MTESKMLCPGNCRVTSKEGKDLGPGYLTQVDQDSTKLFCTTPGCKFGYHDFQTKQDEWMGGVAPINIPLGQGP